MNTLECSLVVLTILWLYKFKEPLTNRWKELKDPTIEEVIVAFLEESEKVIVSKWRKATAGAVFGHVLLQYGTPVLLRYSYDLGESFGEMASLNLGINWAAPIQLWVYTTMVSVTVVFMSYMLSRIVLDDNYSKAQIMYAVYLLVGVPLVSLNMLVAIACWALFRML